MISVPHVNRPWRFLLHLGIGLITSYTCQVWLAQSVVASGTILSTGFDDFSNGALAGQHGWLTAGTGGSTAVVQDSVFLSSGKAVTVTKQLGTNNDRRWAKPVSGLPTQRFVTIDWDMLVSQTTNPVGFGPFFGVDTYDADTTPYVLGSLGVDATTGDVLYQFQDSGVLVKTGSVVVFNAWNHFRIVLDFQTDTYMGYLNGALIAATGFVDRGFGLNNFTDADIATFAASDDYDSQTKSGAAVFDNFVIRDGLVGDFDIDGDVDMADYTRWRDRFGMSVSPAGNQADGSGNGIVDASDYVVWRKHLGTSLFSGIGAGALGAVPEPTGVACLTIAAAVCSSVTVRKTRRRTPL